MGRKMKSNTEQKKAKQYWLSALQTYIYILKGAAPKGNKWPCLAISY